VNNSGFLLRLHTHRLLKFFFQSKQVVPFSKEFKFTREV
jgi:hypothetical protein